MVHGQYETSCVEGMNNLMKSYVDIRGADPITALRRWIDWDSQYYQQRLDLVLNATGKVTPHMEKKLAGQRLALSKYSVTKISNNKRKACVTHLTPTAGTLYCPTYYTELLTSPCLLSGMMATCSCLRYKQGILCDHVAAHIETVGGWSLEQFVHNRDTLAFYKSQYPTSLPEYPSTSFNELRADNLIYMPVITSIRRGRPRKNRFVSVREKAVVKHKRRLKRKLNVL